MCRDLSGRRLADIKEEEKLRKWIEKASEREEEKRRQRYVFYFGQLAPYCLIFVILHFCWKFLARSLYLRDFLIYSTSRQEKYEKLKAGPQKHDFNDPDFIQTREKIMEETDEAFEQGNFLYLLN